MMNAHNETPAPYGDGRPAPADGRNAAPWRGEALGLLIVALFLFFGAAVALIAAGVRIWITLAQDTGVDIVVGLIITVLIALVLSGCAVTSVANKKRAK